MGEEGARPVSRHPSACPTDPCRRGGRAWRPSSFLKGEEKEEDEEEEKKEFDDDDEEMEGKRRDDEDMQDSLVVEED